MESETSGIESRPRIEEAVASYERAREDVLRAVDEQAGPRRWERRTELSTAWCPGPDGAPEGQQRGLPLLGSVGPIPDDAWPAVVDAATATLDRHGFGPPEVVVDRPADHEVQFRDTYGAVLQLGTGADVVVSLRTGCHPLDDAEP